MVSKSSFDKLVCIGKSQIVVVYRIHCDIRNASAILRNRLTVTILKEMGKASKSFQSESRKVLWRDHSNLYQR